MRKTKKKARPAVADGRKPFPQPIRMPKSLPGRTSVLTSISLPPAEMEKLNRLARKQGRSRSGMIGALIRESAE